MARKARQRISYVLPLANSPGGHRLGVNGLAVDANQSILYSGGRDGVICAWDLNLNLKKGEDPFASPEDPEPPSDSSSKTQTSTAFRQQVQAHTHWVNDIVLTQNNSALVSASSDVTVKVWRPRSEESHTAQTVGVHSDYVKCLATPNLHSDWVASGGLDHKICLWDLNGAGKRLEIDVGKSENLAKGSVYALCAKGSILASGGPESVVRVWDPKTGKSITKLVGHTDNVRDIMISQDGDTLMTASSDQTIKVWSLTAGRCMHTLTMHNDSVWSLYSDHPELSVFYSSDRSGMVAKTDRRDAPELDEGVCVAVCQEHDGVDKIIAAGDYIWTATSSSSINRWNDVDTTAEIERPPPSLRQRSDTNSSQPPEISSPTKPGEHLTNGTSKKKIPFNALLRLSITSFLPGMKPKELENTIAGPGMRKASEVVLDNDPGVMVPLRNLPEESIEGQNGLMKHIMLNDRKRVLTLDTTGEVVLWDLLKCTPIRSFGKRHLEDVEPEVNTLESVANWCSVDTRTGKLSVLLEDNYAFDAELYADEVEIEESNEFREDQRINLGKWILRCLFTTLIDEEIKRDEAYRRNLLSNLQEPSGLQRNNAPTSIIIPSSVLQHGHSIASPESIATPRAINGIQKGPTTPGLNIGAVTPSISASHPPSHQNSLGTTHLPPTLEEDSSLEKRISHQSQSRSSSDKPSDYFSANPNAQPSESSSEANNKAPGTPGEAGTEATTTSPTSEKEEKKKSGLFGKKFQMNFQKKLGRNSVEAKPAPAEEKAEETDKSSEPEEKVVEDNFYGIIQKIRNDYDEQLAANPRQALTVGVTPSLPNETPVLKPPPHTQILIQEDKPESGGVADLYSGTLATLGQDADVIEKFAPMWLGDLLLRNQIPFKDTVKVSFVLQPFEDILPSIASPDGNSRLNANRMLRAKKILAYVAERIEPAPEKPDPNALKPEEYLELYCHGQLVPSNMTLATLRVHIWRTGGDIMLYYKANGRKVIGHAKAVAVAEPHSEAGRASSDGGSPALGSPTNGATAATNAV